MVKTLFLVPPSEKVIIRDVYYGCWHEKNWVDYYWPPTYMQQLNSCAFGAMLIDSFLFKRDEKRLFREINRANPEFIVLSSGVFTFNEDVSFLKILKKRLKKGLKIIVYGDYATLYPKKVLENKIVDFVIRGEPEEVLDKLINNFDDRAVLKSLKGVCFKGHISSSKAEVADLDKLPFPKRDIKDASKYMNPFGLSKLFATMTVSRGCKFNCSFCTVPLIYGNSFRRKSIKRVIEEIEMLKAEGYKEIFFRDENLTYEKKFIGGLCDEMIRKKIGMNWMCNSRIDTLNLDLLIKMKKAGCHLIKFGVESGNQDILKKANKNIPLEKIKKVFGWCNQLNIETVAHFIVGLPGETKKSIFQTINFSIALDPFYASFDILRKYPGTKIYGKKTCNLSDKELKKYRKLAFVRFYLRPRLLLKHILYLRSFNQFRNKVTNTMRLWFGFIK